MPRRNLVPKPAALSFAEAACLPTAWLTAYRMLFVKAGLAPGQTVLVQGAGGGVATRRDRARPRGGPARVGHEPRRGQARARPRSSARTPPSSSGARLPERVDAVLETVGEATWEHSLRALQPGGTLVVAGATSGGDPPADLQRVFFLQLAVVGSTMGTRDELERLARFLETSGVRPVIDRELPLADARDGFAAMAAGELVGKVVFRDLAG